jgi:large subunit ribosomal protein L4
MKIEVKDITGKAVGSLELDESIFGADNINEHLLWEAVKWQLAKRRAGNASTKRYGEVRGSSKKVWKQKGTGQARQGSRQAPQWVGGGSVFGPKPRSYEYKLPRQIKKAALRAALALRASESKILVLDKFDIDGQKQLTKSVATALTNLVRGARNLPSSQWLAPEGINVYDILRHEMLILTKDAATAVVEALKGKE